MVKTLKEAEDRIRLAMKPPEMNRGNGFSPGIQGIRKMANRHRPQARGRQLPTVR